MPHETREACAKLKVLVALYINAIAAAPIPIQLEYAIAFTTRSNNSHTLLTKIRRKKIYKYLVNIVKKAG